MLERIYDAWRDLMDNRSDPRTKNFPLMSSPLPTIIICLFYVYIVKVSLAHVTSATFTFSFKKSSDSRSDVYGKEKALQPA